MTIGGSKHLARGTSGLAGFISSLYLWTNSIWGSNAWITFLTMRPLFHLWSAKWMKGSSVQLNSIRHTFFVICSHQRPNDHINSGPGHMIIFSLSRMLKTLSRSTYTSTRWILNTSGTAKHWHFISLIFCLILQLSFAAMRSVVPLFLNKRRCDDDDDDC